MEKFAGRGIHSGSRIEKHQSTITKLSPIANGKLPISSQSKLSRLQAKGTLRPTLPQPFRFHTEERAILSSKQVKVKDVKQNRKQEVVTKTTPTFARPFRLRTEERSFQRVAKAGKFQQLKDTGLAVKKHDKTEVAKTKLDISMVEKDGIEGEEEVKKAYRAAREESDEKEEMSAANKVSSALIGRVKSMLQKPNKETDNADAEIGDRSKILDRGYDDKLYLEEVGAAAMCLKDTQGKGAQELKSYLSKDKDGKILVEDVDLGIQTGDSKILNILLKGSFLSNEVAENVKEGSFQRVAKAGKFQQLKDTGLAVKKQDKTEVAKTKLDISMVEKDGIEGEEEDKKACRVAREEIDQKVEMAAANKVSSTVIDKVESMLQKPEKETDNADAEKETDNADAEIGDLWKILDRDYDEKVEVAAAAMYLKDILGKDGNILVEDGNLGIQTGDSKIVNVLLKGSILSNEITKNVKERSFPRAAKSGQVQELKDTELSVMKQDKTEIAKKEPDNSVVEKGGTEVEEPKKSYRAAGEESDEKAEMAAANAVSSALIGRADSMLWKLENETDDDDAENMKERSMPTVPSLPEVEYGGRLGRVEQVPLAGEKKINQPDLHLLLLGLENQRNCCFLNTIFQVLYLTPWAELFLTQSYSISPIIPAECGFCLLSCPIRAWSSLKLLDLEDSESETLSNADEDCLVSSEMSSSLPSEHGAA